MCISTTIKRGSDFYNMCLSFLNATNLGLAGIAPPTMCIYFAFYSCILSSMGTLLTNTGTAIMSSQAAIDETALLRPQPSQNTYDNIEPAYRAHLTETTVYLLMQIPRATIPLSPVPVTSSAGSDTVCSYPWNIKDPTIFVPGAPPKWSPPLLPVYVDMDCGMGIINENMYRQRHQTFELMFQAISVLRPDFLCADIDVISTDGPSTLSYLTYAENGRRRSASSLGSSQDAFPVARRTQGRSVRKFRTKPHIRMGVYCRYAVDGRAGSGCALSGPKIQARRAEYNAL